MFSRIALSVLVLLGASSAVARPNLDALAARTEQRTLAVSEESLAARGLSVTSVEPRFGVPTFVWADPQSRAATRLTNLTAEQAARTFLSKNADLYRLTAQEVSNAVVSSVHRTDRGPVVVSFAQTVQGVELFRHELHVLMTQDHSLVAMTGYLPPGQGIAIGLLPSFRLGEGAAVAQALQDLSNITTGARSVTAQKTAPGGYTQWAINTRVQGFAYNLPTPARSKRVLFAVPGRWLPAYYVEANLAPANSQQQEYASYVISADDGAVLFRHDLLSNDAYDYKVWADPVTRLPHDSPTGTESSPHPTGAPDQYAPPILPLQDPVTLQSFPFSRNDAWLPPNATQTLGNNVDAYADIAAPDGFQPQTDLRATTTSPNTFGHSYQFDVAPTASPEQRMAAVTSLFYTTNFLHDWLYDAGFDEQSGNPQTVNFGRGGLEGDPLLAEAQDWSLTNGSRAFVPADGASPRIEMGLYRGRPLVTVSAPASLAGTSYAGRALFGPATFDVSGDLVIPNPNGSTPGCTAFPAGSFSGKIVLLDAGSCPGDVKVLNAQRAGAKGVVLANHTASNQYLPVDVSGTGSAVTIPSVQIPLNQANSWKAEVKTNNTTFSVHLVLTPEMQRDAALDNTLVAHEWAHVLTGRLIGNGNGLTNSQGKALGEGWSDFMALLFTVRPEDFAKPQNMGWQGVFTIGAFANGLQYDTSGYFGERRFPYTIDMDKNGLTFRHIAAGATLPPGGVPRGFSNAEPHNAGEVWASALWECYAELLKNPDYSFDDAQDRMKRYLVAALKVTPSTPTFVEARDALLAVAAATDTSDYLRFVAAFANRGLGFGATDPLSRWSTDHLGVKESYRTGETLEVVSVSLDDVAQGCDRDGTLDDGEVGYLTVTLKNVGPSPVSYVTATVAASSTSGAVSLDYGDTLTFGYIAPQATRTARLPIGFMGEANVSPTVTFTITTPYAGPAGSKTFTFTQKVNTDESYLSSATETFDVKPRVWSLSTTGAGGWTPLEENGLRFMRSPITDSAGETTLNSPWLEVNPTGNFTMTLRHRFSFASTDGQAPYLNGGVIEVSDDGVHWYDVLNDLGINPNYVAYLDDQQPHALANDPAFAGLSPGYPGFATKTLDFSNQFAGKKVQVRFRTANAAQAAAAGWDIDSVSFTNIANTPFTTVVADVPLTGGICNSRPVATARAPQQVPETTSGAPTVVTLDGSASFDADGQPLTYQWTQVGGPSVTLSNATATQPTFSTPSVSQDTLLTFQLVVRDGLEFSAPAFTTIKVTNVNAAPIARVTAPATADERTTVTLDGSQSSDPDNNSLSFRWEQQDGPSVTLSSEFEPVVTFTAPEVLSDTSVTFVLYVVDGSAESTKSVTVTIKQVDRAPSVTVPSNLLATARDTVTLSATGSDPDGDAVTYEWTQKLGDAVTLSGADTATAQFVVPNVRTATTFQFEVVAKAQGLSSAPAVVEVLAMPSNRAPVIQVTPSFEAPERTTITLSAAGTVDEDGDLVTYSWTQTGGPVLTLGATDQEELVVALPDVLADTVFTFALTASDLESNSSAEVSVLVHSIDRAPVVTATPVVTAKSRATVTLTANATDPDGDAITFQWTQTDGDTVALDDETSRTPSFTAPDTQEMVTLKFEVVAIANGVGSDPASVEVQVNAENRRPVAHVPEAFGVKERSDVTLSAAGSSDPDGDALTYQWTQVGGSQVTLNGATTATATFTAPDVNAETRFVFQLVVSDGQISSEPAQVVVTVRLDNQAPTASARLVSGGAAAMPVVLDGTASSDPDGDRLTYAWQQLSGDAVQLNDADKGIATFTAPSTASGTTLEFELTVTDPSGVSAKSTVQVKIEPTPPAPAKSGCSSTGGMEFAALPLLVAMLRLRRRS